MGVIVSLRVLVSPRQKKKRIVHLKENNARLDQ